MILLKKVKENEWVEFTWQEYPVVGYSFTEFADRDSLYWTLKINWPDTNQFLWKGDFCIEIGVFRLDGINYKKIVTKRSSSFQIYSKPSVYLTQLQKNKRTNEEIGKIVVPNPVRLKKNNTFYSEEEGSGIVQKEESLFLGSFLATKELTTETDSQPEPLPYKIKLDSDLATSLGSLK